MSLISDQERAMAASGVYVHIPFCLRKCLYCDFNSYPGKENLISQYVEAVRAEIRMEAARHPSPRISTIYFGGGTPNLLTPEQLGSILDRIRECFPVDPDAEITTEANPGVLSPHSDFSSLRRLFNRLSLGIQSFDDCELESLGRIHTTDEAARTFRNAREAGFRNINIDLMYGIPGQTPESWRRTLDIALDLPPEHISFYSLTVEEGTPFWMMHRAGRLSLPGSDAEADMYEEAIRVLEEAGFIHYEISNFAKPGFECRHNITYWQNRPYYGFGAGATSYLDGTRATNLQGIEEYIANISSGRIVKEMEERLEGRAAMGETIFLGLRMLRGVDVDAFTRRYDVSPQEVFPAEIENLSARSLIEVTDGAIRLTRKGIFFANDAFAEFVD